MSNDKSTIFESPTRQRIDLSKSYASIERNTGAKSPLKIMEYPLCEKLDLHSGERLTWACLNSTCKEKLMYCNQCVEADHSDHVGKITVKQLLNKVINKTEEFFMSHGLRDIKGDLQHLKQSQENFDQQCDQVLNKFTNYVNRIKQDYKDFTKNTEAELTNLQNEKDRFYELQKYFETQTTQSREKVIELFKFDQHVDDLKKNSLGPLIQQGNSLIQSFDLVKQNCFESIQFTLQKTIQTEFESLIQQLDKNIQKDFYQVLYDQVYDYQLTSDSNHKSQKDQQEALKIVIISSNNKYFATAGNDSIIRLYDAHTCALLHSFRGHTGSIQSLIFAHDDEKLISGGGDKTIRIWDIKSYQWLATYEGHTAQISSLSLSKNGLHLLSSSYDSTIRIWNLESSECIQVINAHSQSILNAQYCENNDYFITASFDQSLKLWSSITFKCVSETKNNHNYHSGVNVLSMSKNGQFIAAAGPKDSVTILNASNLSVVQNINNLGIGTVTAVVYSKNNKQIFASGSNGLIKIIDTETRSQQQLSAHQGKNSLALSQDELYLLSASDDCSFKKWSLQMTKNYPNQN